MKDKKPKVKKWVKNTVYILAAIVIFLYLLDLNIFGLIGVAIAFLCANKCAEWMGEIGKNVSLAYFLGFVFSLIALIIYWLYYFSKKKL